MRGFFILGLDNPKTPENIGGAIRAAYCYGASSVVISGHRASRGIKHATNTQRGERHMPVVAADDVLAFRPFGTQVVAIDLLPGATELPDFVHPERAIYVFGAEDNTLGHRLTSRAQHIVMVPTRACMNLAACVNVVLYDRMAKALRRAGLPKEDAA